MGKIFLHFMYTLFASITIVSIMIGCPTCVEKLPDLNLPFFSTEKEFDKETKPDTDLQIITEEILKELSEEEKK